MQRLRTNVLNPMGNVQGGRTGELNTADFAINQKITKLNRRMQNVGQLRERITTLVDTARRVDAEVRDMINANRANLFGRLPHLAPPPAQRRSLFRRLLDFVKGVPIVGDIVRGAASIVSAVGALVSGAVTWLRDNIGTVLKVIGVVLAAALLVVLVIVTAGAILAVIAKIAKVVVLAFKAVKLMGLKAAISTGLKAAGTALKKTTLKKAIGSIVKVSQAFGKTAFGKVTGLIGKVNTGLSVANMLGLVNVSSVTDIFRGLGFDGVLDWMDRVVTVGSILSLPESFAKVAKNLGGLGGFRLMSGLDRLKSFGTALGSVFYHGYYSLTSTLNDTFKDILNLNFKIPGIKDIPFVKNFKEGRQPLLDLQLQKHEIAVVAPIALGVMLPIVALPVLLPSVVVLPKIAISAVVLPTIAISAVVLPKIAIAAVVLPKIAVAAVVLSTIAAVVLPRIAIAAIVMPKVVTSVMTAIRQPVFKVAPIALNFRKIIPPLPITRVIRGNLAPAGAAA